MIYMQQLLGVSTNVSLRIQTFYFQLLNLESERFILLTGAILELKMASPLLSLPQRANRN